MVISSVPLLIFSFPPTILSSTGGTGFFELSFFPNAPHLGSTNVSLIIQIKHNKSHEVMNTLKISLT
ncbi:hypothetical protein GLOIN_2v1494637 [Rhizophagus irregularis DAOM 181602=DAOM 197198]|uniref:Uncharacterized protein n=1 Tax=Rhizophagus irregularis (strain DAOM 181602 / DAOM 197198 / MUCL 43194) TaxID=747089 RepID=A0A2P4QZ21_RHIID|nr:hypothetical protein GLOIN_2v1494637 [Rhizophagus irregularis DAOM 181602=DAOM 197198]POG82889.1 hypothetical protein GLOIN_2v1494637 [Rhizophagus irregularis DAOM 181602=DAOM 197198]|eukprot:XP_025189755.1 hypothetical protein GLOIN_2v1494637 [Rhizophagus irregularis DAOM 181602=DAOM 197198]